MRRPSYPVLLLLPLLAFAGCTESGVTSPRGAVQGTVTLEGTPVADVTVELSGSVNRAVTTDGNGVYIFPDVPPGAYVVTVADAPADASFPATSRTAVLSRAETVRVDFTGNYIRTASVTGRVTSRNEGLPGVRVNLIGPDSASTLSSGDGSFAFQGLRSGRYEVAISGFSSSITFPTTRTEVTVGIGESIPVEFSGTPQLTASVVIRALSRPLGNGQSEPVDPNDVRGAVNVALTLDRGEDTVERVELLLAGQVVAQQSFNADTSEPTGQAGAPVELVFLMNTAEFNGQTGETRFKNGTRVLTARLATREGGSSAWTSSFPLTLRNPDTFVARVHGERGPVAGADGEDWIGGEIRVDVVPVVYSPDRQVGTAVVELRRFQGPLVRERGAAGVGIIPVVFPVTGAPAGDNLVGYRTPAGTFDQFRVRSASYTDGAPVPGLPVTVVTPVRIDAVSTVPGS